MIQPIHKGISSKGNPDEYESVFRKELWMKTPEKRIYMIDNLLEKHKLKNMNKQEIVDLLGNPSLIGNFKSPNSFVYHLGTKKNIFGGIDGPFTDQSLVIGFNKDNIVNDYFILTNN